MEWVEPRVEYSTQMWVSPAQNKRTELMHISHARRAKARREWAAVLAALRAQLGTSMMVCCECERKREGPVRS